MQNAGDVVERSQQEPWIQMLGQIAIRLPGREPIPLSGATRVLLATLVAAGPEGATLHEVSNAYWPETRPSSWRIALRVSASHLTRLLPDGWEVALSGFQMRLVPAQGFVDTWRIEAELDPTTASTGRPAWVQPGRPFAGVSGIDLVDRARARIEELLPASTAVAPGDTNPFTATLPLGEEQSAALVIWVAHTRRAIVVTTPEREAAIAAAALSDKTTETSVVVGDRRLLLPLGPFSVAFPELRNEIDVRQGVVEADTTERGFRVVANTLSLRADRRPQRLLIANAHELDQTSLQLATLLIERSPLSEFSMIMCADVAYRELRWLDFIRRSMTAGCELIEVE